MEHVDITVHRQRVKPTIIRSVALTLIEGSQLDDALLSNKEVDPAASSKLDQLE